MRALLSAAVAAILALSPIAAAGSPRPANSFAGDILYISKASANSSEQKVYAVDADGRDNRYLFTLKTSDQVMSAARDNGELLYEEVTSDGYGSTLIERHPDGKIAHTIHFAPKGGFSIDAAGGGGPMAVSPDGQEAVAIAGAPGYNDESLYVFQTSTGKIVAEPIKATVDGMRELSDVTWGPKAGQVTVVVQVGSRYELETMTFTGKIVHRYSAPGNIAGGTVAISAGPSEILYTSMPFDNKSYDGIWRQAVSGGSPVRLVLGPTPSSSALIDDPWSPSYGNYVYDVGSGDIYIGSTMRKTGRVLLRSAQGYYPMWVESLTSPS